MEQNKPINLGLLNYYDKKIKKHVDGKTSTCLRDGGSILFEQLPIAEEQNLMYIYTITNDFITNDKFVTQNKEYQSGTTVRVVKVGEEFKYDVYSIRNHVTQEELDEVKEFGETTKNELDSLKPTIQYSHEASTSAHNRLNGCEQQIYSIETELNKTSLQLERLSSDVEDVIQSANGQILSLNTRSYNASYNVTLPTDSMGRVKIDTVGATGCPTVKNLITSAVSKSTIEQYGKATIVDVTSDGVIIDVKSHPSANDGDYLWGIDIGINGIEYDNGYPLFCHVIKLSGDEPVINEICLYGETSSYGQGLYLRREFSHNLLMPNDGSTSTLKVVGRVQIRTYHKMTGRYCLRFGRQLNYSKCSKLEKIVQQSPNKFNLDYIQVDDVFYSKDTTTGEITVLQNDWRSFDAELVSTFTMAVGGYVTVYGGTMSVKDTSTGEYFDIADSVTTYAYFYEGLKFKLKPSNGEFPGKVKIMITDSFESNIEYANLGESEDLFIVPREVQNLPDYGVHTAELCNYIDLSDFTYHRVCTYDGNDVISIEPSVYDVSGYFNSAGIVSIKPGWYLVTKDETGNPLRTKLSLSYIKKVNINGD